MDINTDHFTPLALRVRGNDRNECNLHNRVQKIYIKTEFIAINSTNTLLYVTGHGKRDHFNKFLEIEFCTL